jgi:hypothetical protein
MTIDEIMEMDEDAQFDHLLELDVFTEEEWEIYKEVTTGSYQTREINRRTLTTESGDEFLLSVEAWSDGERPDEMNTRINVVKQDD